MSKIKSAVIVVLSFSVLMFLGRSVMAASEFITKYRSIYQVNSSGLTTVRHQVELKNKVSNVYAEKFSIAVGFTDLKNIKVQDARGSINPEIETSKNQTVIRFDFLNKVVGKGKVNKFYIQYQTDDIANKNGAVWEINIPKLETEKGVEENQVTLIVPSEFGQPAYISPRPIKQTNRSPAEEVSNTFEFEGSVLNREAISAVFGRVQYMEIELNYHLENRNHSILQTEIALPPDTSYQTMMYEEITPEPINVREDKDGNWLAVYRLKPQKKIDVKVKGVARINFFPQSEAINMEEKERYIKANEIWKTKTTKVGDLGNKLDSAQAIYDYVVDYLNYDFERIEEASQRQSIDQVIASQLAICTGYTDLFVTLARAARIPARELEGYALTNNDKLRPLSLKKDVLHSWPEYYDEDKKAWIQVDPTWDDTTGGVDYFNKLDLNHLVFVIHGSDPHQPVPAGGYKLAGQNEKDIEVKAVEPQGFPEPKLDFKVLEELNNSQLVIEISNQGKTAYKGQVRVDSEPTGIIRGDLEVEGLPPHGKKKVKITADLPSKWKELPVTIIFNYGQEEKQISINLEPPFKKKTTMAAVILGVGGVLLTAAWWARRIFF